MKIIRKCLLLLIALIFLINPFAYAAEGVENLSLVTDYADLLTVEEHLELSEKAAQLASQYKCDVALFIIDTIDDADPFEYAEFLYEEYEMGYGPDRNLLLLFISLYDHSYALIGYGYGNTAFTDHGKEVMLNKHLLPELSEFNFSAAFTAYYDIAEEYLAMAQAGTPFDKDTDPHYKMILALIKFAFIFLLPLIIAGIVTWLWRGQMKTAILASEATNYIIPGSFQLTSEKDTFLYSEETSRIIEKNSSSGSSSSKAGGSGYSGKF